MNKNRLTIVLVLVVTFAILAALAWMLYKAFANSNKLDDDLRSINDQIDTINKETEALTNSSLSNTERRAAADKLDKTSIEASTVPSTASNAKNLTKVNLKP